MKIFLFYFEIAIRITGSAQNYRVRRVSGNTPIVFRPNTFCICDQRRLASANVVTAFANRFNKTRLSRLAVHYIMLTCSCDLGPLTTHCFIVELGLTVFIFALKHRLWVLVRTASIR